MPSYVISPQSILTVSFLGRHEAQQVMNVFTYRYNGSAELPDGVAAANAVWTNLNGVAGLFTVWREALSVKVTQIEARLQWTHPDRFAYIVKTDPAKTEGAIGGDAYPVNTSAVITKRTINAGRDQVGAVHVPGVPMTFFTNGILQPAGLDAYAAVGAKTIEAINTAIPAAEYLPVLFHRTSPAVSPQVTNISVQGFARIMRRRTVGVGS